MRMEITESGETVNVLEERSLEPVHIVLKVELENGVVLLFDDKLGRAVGSDGGLYAPVCRAAGGTEGDAVIIGWCVGEREVFL